MRFRSKIDLTKKEGSGLSDLVKNLSDVRAELREQGASAEVIAQTTERMVRDAWPSVREWKYLCDDCSDTGWKFGICTPSTPCGRPFKLPGQRDDDYTGQGRCSPNHDYVRPCRCQKGAVRRAQMERRPTTEDFTSAGKSKPMTRFGR